MRPITSYALTAVISIALVGVLAYALWPVIEVIGSGFHVIGSALAGTK